jgi:hypothetical protein
MHRLLTFIAACMVSSAMAFAQGTATDQTPASRTSPSSAQGQPSRTPSTPNQALPGDSNPANAGTRDAQANGSAVRPKSANGGTPGTAAGSSANPPDSNDTNGLKKDDTGSNPAAGHTPTTSTNSGTIGRSQWFWIALGIFVALILIGALVGRNRVAADIDETDPALRTHREPDVIRREEIYRARRDDIDRDEDDIRRAG